MGSDSGLGAVMEEEQAAAVGSATAVWHEPGARDSASRRAASVAAGTAAVEGVATAQG